jgi:hypothetical protein
MQNRNKVVVTNFFFVYGFKQIFYLAVMVYGPSLALKQGEYKILPSEDSVSSY